MTGALTALLILCCFFLNGCAGTSRNSDARQETISAVGSVTGALAGRELSPKEVEQLGKAIQNDKEAQSAVESIGGALGVHDVHVKYCPKTGKRYSAELEICPEHGEPLEKVE